MHKNNRYLKGIKRHSSDILLAFGIGAMYIGAGLTGKATLKADKILEQEEVDRSNKKEVVKSTWKCYVAPTAMYVLGTACIIGSNNVNKQKSLALSTAYTLSERAFHNYKEKVVEHIGLDEEKKIQESVSEDQIRLAPPVSSTIVCSGSSDVLCYDSITGNYFSSTADKINKAINTVNKTMLDDMYVSLNDFYYEIGAPQSSVGEDLGWNINDGLMDVSFSSHLKDDSTPCLVLNYNRAPEYGYDQFQ